MAHVQSRRFLPLVLLIIAGLGLILHRLRPPPDAGKRRDDAPSSPPVSAPGVQSNPPAATLPSPAAAPRPRTTSQKLADALEQTLAVLRDGTLEAKAAALNRLRQLLESTPPSAAIAAVRAFLATRQDASTGQGYAVGLGGRLDKAPTLRTFLLDELGAIARATGNSRDLAAASREILASPTSADEWSIAMRNLAWAEPNSGEYLNTKFRELLSQNQWLQKPTSGFLEAFDIPVHTHDAGSISLLAPLLRTQADQPVSVSRAAAIALDRLAEQSPLEVMNYLNSNPGTLADRAMLRADYFAKANLDDPSQRAALETYFSRTDVSDSEKAKSVEGLVSPGSFVSDSLLATTPVPDDSAKREKTLAKAATDWTQRFPAVASRLKALLQLNQ